MVSVGTIYILYIRTCYCNYKKSCTSRKKLITRVPITNNANHIHNDITDSVMNYFYSNEINILHKHQFQELSYEYLHEN